MVVPQDHGSGGREKSMCCTQIVKKDKSKKKKDIYFIYKGLYKSPASKSHLYS